MNEFAGLLNDVRRCTACAGLLPHGPRPVLQAHPDARILIISQAPGRRVHASGIPFDDPSGDRLRDWLGISRDVFYDETKIAIVPMAFCYPGTGKTGDLPPPEICSRTWHERLFPALPNVQVRLLVGRYALARYLSGPASLTATVQGWRWHWPHTIPLPHPSPRNNRWLARNPWFERELRPAVRKRVSECLSVGVTE